MESLTQTSWPVFCGLTIVVMGFAAFMTGRALADNWRPVWQVWIYCLLLGLVDRFLAFALFDAELLLITGYLVDAAVLTAIGLASYYMARAHRMASQYPWLYERAGLFRLRRRDQADGPIK